MRIYLLAALLAMATVACSHATTSTTQAAPDSTPKLVGTGGGPIDDQEQVDENTPPSMKKLESQAQESLENSTNPCSAMEDDEHWDDAANCYAELVQDQSSSEYVEHWLIKSASNFERHGEPGKAQIVRLFLLQHIPHSDYAPDVLVIIADDFRDHHAEEKALPFYATYLQAFPDGVHREYVREQCKALGGCDEYDWDPI
ncbi:MAG: tetratricopeptide repeat protein [Bradymonadaceae bacterium]